MKDFRFPRPSRPCPVCKQGQEVEVERDNTRPYGILAHSKGTVTYKVREWVCAHCKEAGDQGLGYLDDNHPFTDDVQDTYNHNSYYHACQTALNDMRGSDLKSMREWAGLSHEQMGELIGLSASRVASAEEYDDPLFHGLLSWAAKHLIAMEAAHPGLLRDALRTTTFLKEEADANLPAGYASTGEEP